jgi:tetratricopeptide (TPR) repeat protein
VVPIWHIPFARNPFFTGREDLLLQLYDRLHATQAIAISQPQAIHGLGGIGKTQLAVEYTYRFAQKYQVILWAWAHTTEALYASYTKMARLLKLPQQDAQEQGVIVQAVKDWLQTSSGWLLILDNADELNVVQPFLPTRFAGHLLLTTRAQIMGKLARPLEVSTLEAERGALLLLRRARVVPPHGALETASATDRAAAMELTRELGGLPLALDQAGAYIERMQCSLADYRQQYRTRRAKLLAHRGTLVDDHPEPVATTWSISFQKVATANPLAAELLRACAFLAPDAIPEALLVGILQIPLLSANTRRGWRGWFAWLTSGLPRPLQATSREAIQDALAVLRAYSLLERKTVSVHRLVQAVILDELNERTRNAWITRIVCAMDRCFPVVRFETWGQCADYLPHALACYEWMEQHHLELREGASLLNRSARYLYERALYMEAEPLYLRALALCEKLLGPEHLDTAQSLNDLAVLYKNRGDFARAQPLFLRALAIRETRLGPEHPDTAQSLNDLAVLYKNQDDFVRAQPLHLRALTIRETRLGPEHLDTAQSLNDLAALYQNRGDFARAQPLYLRALAIRERLLGPEHPDTAQSLNDLAVLYQNQGDFARAQPLYLRALALCEKLLGPEHPDTATSLNNLAALYQSQGDSAQAQPLYLRALAIREMRLGPEHPDTASSLNDLAWLYQNQDDFARAQPLYLRALAIREMRLGPEHPATASSLNNLAVLYQNQGDFVRAQPLFLRALAICEKLLGPEHPGTASSLNNLAWLYQNQDDFAQAQPLYLRALAIREMRLGPEHPDTAQSLNNLAALYQSQGDFAQAQPLYLRALAICEHALGQNHPHTHTVRKNYTTLLEAMKQKSSSD